MQPISLFKKYVSIPFRGGIFRHLEMVFSTTSRDVVGNEVYQRAAVGVFVIVAFSDVYAVVF